MIKSFSDFINEQKRVLYFPILAPFKKHKEFFESVDADYIFIPNASQTFIKHLRRLFPQQARKMIFNEEVSDLDSLEKYLKTKFTQSKIIIPEKFEDGNKAIIAVKSGDFDYFTNFIPNYPLLEAKDLFNQLRSDYGCDRINNIRKHIQLEKVSDLRERYISGKVFNVGDEVLIKENSLTGVIIKRRTNHLVVDVNGKLVSKWITDIQET
jgi:hypothetical protein